MTTSLIEQAGSVDTQVVPYELPADSKLNEEEKNHFINARRALLSELRMVTGLPDVVQSFDQDTVYKLVMAPEGAELLRDSTTGNIKGVFYKDGRIVEHAKFSEVKPSMTKAAKAVGTQVLLISIAMQLNRIEETLSKVFEEFHGDRLGEIAGGQALFDESCHCKDEANRKSLARKAIAELRRGFEKTVSALARQIKDLPAEKIGFLDNWGGNKACEAAKKLRLAQESFHGCLHAMQTMARCYLLLDEQDVAIKAVNDCMRKLKEAGLDMAYQRSRLVKKNVNGFPEEGWQQFIDYQKDYALKNDSLGLPQLETRTIEVEFKPSELRVQI